MKALIASLFLGALFGGQVFASDANAETAPRVKKAETKNLLTPKEEELFKSGKLGETVVTPVYSSSEQLIYTELVKQLKQKKD